MNFHEHSPKTIILWLGWYLIKHVIIQLLFVEVSRMVVNNWGVCHKNVPIRIVFAVVPPEGAQPILLWSTWYDNDKDLQRCVFFVAHVLSTDSADSAVDMKMPERGCTFCILPLAETNLSSNRFIMRASSHKKVTETLTDKPIQVPQPLMLQVKMYFL